ncbi:calcium channel, voltage-dependent, gamma subunit 1a isoform X2 [Lates calcarifer]|uniref:Calcium channel, voltage-dependent, gamma subunit 1a isoform X2 n=1 Tax=Lates calcarifer TaxID=8187 RepID=A0AAJ7LD77_LATCA|nr:calcium channel, voltage-dependent, gamma subunit 1a isoform X2 [Lates calcarifer]
MHKRTKIKIAIFVLLVGMACMFTAVVTDHWAVLSPKVDKVNETCEAAHFGLWRLCKKHIYMTSENYVDGHGCGPISLPGEENCTYFRHFTPGQDAEIFEYKTQKDRVSQRAAQTYIQYLREHSVQGAAHPPLPAEDEGAVPQRRASPLGTVHRRTGGRSKASHPIHLSAQSQPAAVPVTQTHYIYQHKHQSTFI